MEKEKRELLGITVKKDENWSQWFTQVITKTEMIEYYDVGGCYILRPWSYEIWESIQQYFDSKIKKLGVKNAYFPLFVSQKSLFKEKDHIEDFAPEVAWVTKAGQSEMKEPIAVRPTSETIMYPAYAKWIRSHRDLPLKLNQWNNVVRWEFKKTVPFLRSREFLWQEGHTVFSNKEEADKEVLDILDLYRMVYEDLLAIPVVPGKKSDKEKFAGGDYTTTVEAFIDCTGRAIQGATSHSLGQNFSKMFDIKFEDENKNSAFAWQNSWGLTTRTIGVMVMVHGDDKGLFLPPKVSPIQIVIVPIYIKKQFEVVDKAARDLEEKLVKGGFRVEVDDRKTHNPGFKFNEWETKGIPLRVEIGPRDVQNGVVVAARRDKLEKEDKITLKNDESILESFKNLLDQIQNGLFERASLSLSKNISVIDKWDQFVPSLNLKKLVLASWCGDKKCEEWIKNTSSEEGKNIQKDLDEQDEKDDAIPLSAAAKSLCTPFDQDKFSGGRKFNKECINHNCQNETKGWTLFGRSY